MLLPARFGKYILLKELEVGGMAAVFLAKAQGIAGFEKFLAIKKIFAQLSRSEDFVQMFVSEARIAGELSHPNISHIYDLGEVDGDYFIAMEYIHGKDAYRLIKRCQSQVRRIPLNIVCYITLQVLEGLDYAHKKKDLAGQPMRIVHRDVSPRNILLSYDGGVKLIDFGIAKAATLGEHTRVGTIKGKVNYMSPEQARGEELDARSDLFSVGLLMYELIYQAKLFTGGSEIKTLDMIRECHIPNIREQNPDLPEEIERILMRSLARERELRYATAHEMAKDIQQFVHRNDMVVGSSTLAEFMQECFAKELEQEQRELDAYRHVSLELTGSRPASGNTRDHEGSAPRPVSGVSKRATADTRSFPDDFVEDPTQLQQDEISPDDLRQENAGEQSRVDLAPGPRSRAGSLSASASAARTPGQSGATYLQGVAGKRASSSRSPMLAAITGVVVVGAGIVGWQMFSARHSGVEVVSNDQAASTGITGSGGPGGPTHSDPRVREVPSQVSVEAPGGSSSDPSGATKPVGSVAANNSGTTGAAETAAARGTTASETPGSRPTNADGVLKEGARTPASTATGESRAESRAASAAAVRGASSIGQHGARSGGEASSPSAAGSRVAGSGQAGQTVPATGPAAPSGSTAPAHPGGASSSGAPSTATSSATSSATTSATAARPVDGGPSGEASSGSPAAPVGTSPESPGSSGHAAEAARSAGAARPADLVTGFGYLNINATTPCQVLVDGVATGLTTPVKQLKVPVGKRKIELERLSDKAIRSWDVEVKPQQVYPVLWR